MEIIFLPDADSDLKYWIKTGNKTILKKLAELIASIKLDPYKGIGKPEKLKYNLNGCWSRRLDKEHRLVYEILDSKLIIHSAKGHYE